MSEAVATPPVELRAARKAAAERLMAIAMAELPPGWTYSFRKSLTGCCHARRKHIAAPKPVTRKSLYIWLHECAHAHEPEDYFYKVPQYVAEMRAEKWAHAKMREHGVPVPRAMTVRAKFNVAHKIAIVEPWHASAEASGVKCKPTDPEARAFVGAPYMALIAELRATDWELVSRGKHWHLRIGGALVSVLPPVPDSKQGWLKTRHDIRRYRKRMRGGTA
jgi:hypothetical protein